MSSSATTLSRPTVCEPSWVAATVALGGSQPTRAGGWAQPASWPGSGATRRRPSTCWVVRRRSFPVRDSVRPRTVLRARSRVADGRGAPPSRGDARCSARNSGFRWGSAARPACPAGARLRAPVQRSRRTSGRAARTGRTGTARLRGNRGRPLARQDVVDAVLRARLDASRVRGGRRGGGAGVGPPSPLWVAGLACLAFLASATQNGPTPVRQAIRVCQRLLAKADLGGEANVLPPLAELEAMRGRFAEARRLVARARAVYGQLGQYALAETNCGPVEGRIELLAGDPAAAEQSFRASYEALERIGGLSYSVHTGGRAR